MSSFLGAELAVVWLDYYSETISGISWFMTFKGKCLLEYCLTTLARALPWPLVAVGPSKNASRIQETVSRSGVPFHWVGSRRDLSGLCEAGRMLKVERCLLLHPLWGLGFVPLEILRNLIGYHRRAGGEITGATELPLPLNAYVYEQTALDALGQIPAAGGPDDIGTVFLTLEQSGAFGEKGSGIPKFVSCPSLSQCGVDPAGIPRSIPWQSVADVQRLEGVHDMCETRGFEKLVRLRARLVSDLERLYRLSACRPMRHPTKVLYASASSAFSGAEQCLIRTIEAFRGCDVKTSALVAREGTLTECLRATGTRVWCPGGNFAIPTARNVLLLCDLLKEVDPDVIHCNGFVGAPLLAASRLQGIPLVQWARSANFDDFEEHLLTADRITAVSSFIAEQSARQIVDSAKIRVVYDCVNCDRFAPGVRPARNIREEFGIPREDFVVLCIARFAHNKRHDVLIDACSTVSKSYSRLRLILIGESLSSGPSTFEDCLARIEARGLAPTTLVRGFEPDVMSFESGSDAVVLCSEKEALGTVVLESMSLGKPVIVAASGGLLEVVEDGISGLHCPPGRAEILAEKLLMLISNPGLRQELGMAARARAENLFSMRAHADLVRRVYSELV